MTGYYGYSKSNNAVFAENQGKMNATNFAKWLRKISPFWKGVTSKFVSTYIPSCEWHHTSMHYNITNYYDPFEFFEDRKNYRKFFLQWKENKKLDRKKPKELYFKSWNMFKTVNPCCWEWKITNRYGKNCYSLNIIAEDLRKYLKNYIEKNIGRRTEDNVITIESMLEDMKLLNSGDINIINKLKDRIKKEKK
jgi:hypothetical protein